MGRGIGGGVGMGLRAEQTRSKKSRIVPLPANHPSHAAVQVGWLQALG
mgnify:CR=1 FL=1